MAIGTDSNINIVAGLPPEAGENELCAIDLEIFGIPEGKIHRPVGTFACASVFLERDMDGVNYTDNIPVYQVYDPHDLPALVERIGHGRWVFQNGAFDIRQMRRWAEIRPRKIWDTMVVDQGLWGGYYSSFDLASLSLRYLHEYMAKDVREDFSTATEMTPEMKLYAAQDPVTTLRVALAQMDYIAESGRTMHHYWKADHPAIWAILDMPAVRVSAAGWEELGRDFEAKRDALDALYPGINLGSTQQVNARICELMGRKNLYKSVDEDHLLEILDEAQQKGRDRAAAFVQDVLARRKYATYASRYGFNWIANYLEDGEWVNAHWKAVQALTGRLACGDPNLMQIPSREFPIYRSFFTASDGGVILVADVAQQEPRITAKLSMDKHLVEAVRAGESTHVVTGRRVYHDESFSKASPLYNVAKQVNLGLSYGMTARGLAQKTGLAIDEAQEVVDAYFVAFPGVKSYMHKYRQMAHRQGYVETLLGRRSYINPYSRKWENNAINSPIQGCLPSDTRVLTRHGWVEIGKFVDHTEVWTGERWAEAVRLDKGKAPRVRLHLSDGRTFDCDNRHKLLVQTGPWPEWCSVMDIQHKPIVRDLGSDWGLGHLEPEDWYWAGRFIGDGWFSKTTNGNKWGMVFGYDEKEDVDRFIRWLEYHREWFLGGTNSMSGYHLQVVEGSNYRFTGGTKRGLSAWLALGIEFGWNSHTKRVPSVVYTLDKERRKAFLTGYIDADGCRGGRTTKITSVNHALLEDVVRLMQTLGMTGAIGHESVNSKGSRWWELYIHKEPHTLYVSSVDVLDPEPMYTLSVNDERHAFSSEGLISKNSAADQMKIAMGFVHQESKARGLPFCLSMVVHDEMVCDVPKEIEPEYRQLIEDAWQHAGRLTLGDTVPIVIEMASGSNWGCKH